MVKAVANPSTQNHRTAVHKPAPGTAASAPSETAATAMHAMISHLRVLKTRSSGPSTRVPTMVPTDIASSTLPRPMGPSACTSAR